MSTSHFAKALKKLGVELSTSDLERCAEKWDRRGDGRVKWREFVSWAKEDSEEEDYTRSSRRRRHH